MRIVSSVIVAALVLTLAACGGNSQATPSSPNGGEGPGTGGNGLMLPLCVTFDQSQHWVVGINATPCRPGQYQVDATEGICPVDYGGFNGAGNHRYLRIDPG